MAGKLTKWQTALRMTVAAPRLRSPKMTRLMVGVPTQDIKQRGVSVRLSDDMVGRILSAYHKTPKIEALSEIWAGLSSQNGSFLEALESKDAENVSDALNSMFSTALVSGMGHGHMAGFKKAKKKREAERYFNLRTRDAILSLAEALAVKPLYSNYQTTFKEYLFDMQRDLAPLIEDIEKTLNHSVVAPSFGDPPVVEHGSHAVSPDSIRHAYVMHRVRQLGFTADDRILEIGGGFGNVARYATLNGFRNYGIVDLPYVSAIQAAYLAGTIGEENVGLYGETQDAWVRLYPSTNDDAFSTPAVLTLNMDSLPEIPDAEARAYLIKIRAMAGHFLSINQEAEKAEKETGTRQVSVPTLTRALGGFTRLHRHPYWPEQGYAEELYLCEPNA